MNSNMIRRTAVAATAALALTTAAPAAAAQPAPGGGVSCRYVFTAYPGGFVASVQLTNTGPAVNGWSLRWSFPVDTVVQGVWQSRITQPDPRSALAVNAPWNAGLPTNTSLSFGWTAAAPSTDQPTDLVFNGVPC